MYDVMHMDTHDVCKQSLAMCVHACKYPTLVPHAECALAASARVQPAPYGSCTVTCSDCFGVICSFTPIEDSEVLRFVC